MAYGQLSDFSRAIVLGVADWFTENWNSYKSQYSQYVWERTADLETEKYDSVDNLPAAGEIAEGAGFSYGKVGQAYETQIQNKKFGNGIQFTIESMAYDKYRLTIEAKASELAHTMRNYEEELAATPYNNAFATNLADGVPLISNAHPCKNVAGTVNNNLTTGDLSPDTIKAGVKLFASMKDHQGKPIRSFPNQLLTHEINMMEVEEILNSSNKAYEQSNTKNVIPKLTAAYSRWFTDEDMWFLRDTNFKHVILQFYQGYRNKMDWDEDFDTKNLKGTCYSLGASGARPLGGVGIVGSAGV